MAAPSPSSSASAAESEVDEWASDSPSSSTSRDSDDDNGESIDTFGVFAKPQADWEKNSPGSSPPRLLRGRHGRKPSVIDSSDQSARAYSDALRSVREPGSFHRASISVGSPGSTSGAHLSEDTRRRHRESKKRMVCADLTQTLLFRAHELDQVAETVPLWLHATVVPPRWRKQIVDHLTQIHAQTQFCRDRVVAVWHLLLPPFDRANLHEFEQRLALFEKTVTALEAAITQCQDHVTEGERISATTFLQMWYRRCLARRQFYTKTLQVHSRQTRGLIPGLFDTIAATSRLTIHPGTPRRTTLEYPTSPATAKYAFRY